MFCSPPVRVNGWMTAASASAAEEKEEEAEAKIGTKPTENNTNYLGSNK